MNATLGYIRLIVQGLVADGTYSKKCQRFELRPFVREGNLCSKRHNSLRSVTAVINLRTFYVI